MRSVASLGFGRKSRVNFVKGNIVENRSNVTLNPDENIVKQIRKGLKKKGGFCPCRAGKKPENKCICEEFKGQIEDPEFEGFCHCKLYYKSK